MVESASRTTFFDPNFSFFLLVIDSDILKFLQEKYQQTSGEPAKNKLTTTGRNLYNDGHSRNFFRAISAAQIATDF